ncbi:MAG: hybrid sensor histidine kinase/response regulator, partial [Gemmatimonadaceae bacterium]
RLETRADGEQVLLEVTDTGPGVAPEARARIFEPFFTTKSDGTGLGLSVSYGIVTAHGGAITVARSSEHGTTFRVSLSAATEDAVRQSEREQAAHRERSALRGKRLLFVDDEPSLRSGISAFGRLRRFSVVTAEDGAAALAAARLGDFDLVVCDLRMPGMDGRAFYGALRVEHPELAARTVFITGDVVSASSQAFLDEARRPVLMKPFEFERLESTLAGLLEGRTAVAISAA